MRRVGLGLCFTLFGCAANPGTNPELKSDTARTAKPSKWVYQLSPIHVSTEGTNGRFHIWHVKNSSQNFTSKSDCMKAANMNLKTLGGEAWNYKANCRLWDEYPSPVQVIDASEIDAEK